MRLDLDSVFRLVLNLIAAAGYPGCNALILLLFRAVRVSRRCNSVFAAGALVLEPESTL